jgi:hypothetical protein
MSRIEAGAKRRVPRAGLAEKGFAFRSIGPLEGLAEEDFFPLISRFHTRAELLHAPKSLAVTGASQRLVAEIKCLYRSGPPYGQV